MTDRRLIEESFPLQKVSKHSKHEKNVRHGHISTLHIWPARRPLAACRAAIIAALMPDPGSEEGRHELNEKIVSITKWKTENGPALDYFREEIRKAFGGRAPRVLDMFAGGGAIPLEAMRLGCEVTAIDYNPVAWFILKCTLEFPQRLAGKTWPLPVGESNNTPEVGAVSKLPLQTSFDFEQTGPKEGDLADHVRYWGNWVLERAREELAPYYPTIDGQPTVAYLWARTVPCPDPKCGTIVPLLKTLWLCKKAEKTKPDTPENRARPDFLRIKRTKNTSKVVINARRALRLVPPKKGEGGHVRFEIWTPGAKDKVPGGTMSRAKTQCPCCGINTAKNYIKECGHAGKMSEQMTAVVVDTGHGKGYRLPRAEEVRAVQLAAEVLPEVAEQIPYGLPTELLPGPEVLGFRAPLYGFKTWGDLFTRRQLLALTTFVKLIRLVHFEMEKIGYSSEWTEAVIGYLAISLDRLADRSSTLCRPDPTPTQSGVINTFSRFALPITWDFIEGVTIQDFSGGFINSQEWVLRYIKQAKHFVTSISPTIVKGDATKIEYTAFDAVITDPPYYDAIPYADLSDFFYVWLRRVIGDQYPQIFTKSLTPKTGELVQQGEQAERKSKSEYESGMAQAFQKAWHTLTTDGRLVIVFAHKDPNAWETVVTAIIQAGFTVTASWPIDTEMGNRVRASGSAALSSSIWLVCRKRPARARIGRYRGVRKAMEKRITERLRYFWDMGLSGPDFVWAAIGPALESYSSYKAVKRLDGSPFTVSDFLKDVRRMVADFALGRILKGHSTEGLDEWTRYYLMQRSNFGLENAPVGECILLSQGYGLDLNDLRTARGFIEKASGSNVRLAKWDERTRDDLGDPHPSGGLPIIDMLHRLMRLWAAGNLDELNNYAAERGVRQNELFWSVAQAILEMAHAGERERSLLEALVAWGRGQKPISVEVPSQGAFEM